MSVEVGVVDWRAKLQWINNNSRSNYVLQRCSSVMNWYENLIRIANIQIIHFFFVFID